MKQIKFSLYSLQTKTIPKGVPKNWTSTGKLSKRAKQADGSFMLSFSDVADVELCINEVKNMIRDLKNLGYSNIHSGYVDSTLHATDNEGEQYIGYIELINEAFPNGITLGFSKYLTN